MASDGWKPPIKNYAPHRISPPPPGWLGLVPALVFEQMSLSYSPKKYEPDYQGGLHPDRVDMIVKTFILVASWRQVYYTRGGRSDPHYQIAPWDIDAYGNECKRLGIPSVVVQPNTSYCTNPDDSKGDWFISVWNHGTEEWTEDFDELYAALHFGEMADVFALKHSELLAGGRGVAGVSAGTTAQSYVGRDGEYFINLPSLTKHTPDWVSFFPAMTNLAKHVGFVDASSVDPVHYQLFNEPIHRQSLVDNKTYAQQFVPSLFLRCHCDGFNALTRGGILTALHVYLEHDMSAYEAGIPLKFILKRDTQIAYQKKACDDFMTRRAVIGPIVKWIEGLWDSLPD